MKSLLVLQNFTTAQKAVPCFNHTEKLLFRPTLVRV